MHLLRVEHGYGLTGAGPNRSATVSECMAAVLPVEFPVLSGGSGFSGRGGIFQPHGRLEAFAADSAVDVPGLFVLSVLPVKPCRTRIQTGLTALCALMLGGQSTDLYSGHLSPTISRKMCICFSDLAGAPLC